jgi:hypothetical protein
VYVFAPGKEVKKHIRGKVLRCSTKLMEYRYEVEHIDGESNVWADMVSRWTGDHAPVVRLCAMQLRMRARDSHTEHRPKRRRRKKNQSVATDTEEVEEGVSRPLSRQLRPLDDLDFEWPTLSAVLTVQNQHAVDRPRDAKGDAEDGWFIDGRLWIPSKAESLIQRLLVVAHCGAQAHRGREAMIEGVRLHFDVQRLRAHVESFLSACLMCKHVKGAKILQRPWGPTFRTNERNGALHFDYLSIGDSFEGDQYMLVLKDEATHFVALTPCATPTSTVVVEAMLAWHSRYGLPRHWISDRGSHFRNEVMKELRKRLKSRHDFTVAYSPWINGSVERANRDIAQVLRVLCLEYKVDTHDWTFFVPILLSSLNHTPVPSLGKKAPVELFYGLPIPSPLRLCLDSRQKEILEIPEQPEAIAKWLDQLRSSIRDLHKPMIAERARQTVRNQKQQKSARRRNFDVGDFVVRSRVDQNHYEKLFVTWVGPYQVVRADAHCFAVRHLLTGEETDVHPSRLKFYADQSLEVTAELRDHIAAQ